MPTTTNYIWDEQNYLAESDATNTINVVYTNEPQQYGNLISSRISGATSYHQFDALGSTRQLTNGAGGVTDAMAYDAWGNVVSRMGSTTTSLQWLGSVGYYSDSQTGFVWVRERALSPAVARWSTADVVGVERVAHLFRYADNSAIVLDDPSGLETVIILPPVPGVGIPTGPANLLCIPRCVNCWQALEDFKGLKTIGAREWKRNCVLNFHCESDRVACLKGPVDVGVAKPTGQPPDKDGNTLWSIDVCLNCNFVPMEQFRIYIETRAFQECGDLDQGDKSKVFKSCESCVTWMRKVFDKYCAAAVAKKDKKRCVRCGVFMSCYGKGCKGAQNPPNPYPDAREMARLNCECDALGLRAPAKGCDPSSLDFP